MTDDPDVPAMSPARLTAAELADLVIFGRTVNLAGRISDVAPSGELYVPASISGALSDRFVVEPVGATTLQGVGAVELARVSRTTP
jgi:class 3 adenylate cyclase